MRAVRLGDAELVRILEEEECYILNKRNETGLILAARLDRPELCEILAPKEKAIFLPDGRSPLMVAAQEGSSHALAVLLPFYPEKDKDLNGCDVLYYAVMSQSLTCTELVLQSYDFDVEELKKALRHARKLPSDAIFDLVRTRLCLAQGMRNGCGGLSESTMSVLRDCTRYGGQDVSAMDGIQPITARSPSFMRPGEEWYGGDGTPLQIVTYPEDLELTSRNKDDLERHLDDMRQKCEDAQQDVSNALAQLAATNIAKSKAGGTQVTDAVLSALNVTLLRLKQKVDNLRIDVDIVADLAQSPRGDVSMVASKGK